MRINVDLVEVGYVMGDTKLPPELPDTEAGEGGSLEHRDDLNAEIFEIAGSIKWFDASKGYGFIVPDNGLPDVLLHVTCLRAGGYPTAYEGARVHCQVMARPKGMQAFRILSMDESTAIHSFPATAAHPRGCAAGKRLGAGHGKVVQPCQRLRFPYPR